MEGQRKEKIIEIGARISELRHDLTEHESKLDAMLGVSQVIEISNTNAYDATYYASQLGKRGGMKTAERGPEYFSRIAGMRKTKSGGRPRTFLAEKCPICKSEAQRFGTNRNGSQRFRCVACKKTFSALVRQQV